eukprot:9890-Eustigmatos_ZCMA.PRE.1
MTCAHAYEHSSTSRSHGRPGEEALFAQRNADAAPVQLSFPSSKASCISQSRVLFFWEDSRVVDGISHFTRQGNRPALAAAG